MRTILLVFCLCLMATPALAHSHHHWRHDDSHHDCYWDDVSIDSEGGSTIITHNGYDDVVEITGDYELYVNDRHVKTDRTERRLLEEFCTGLEDIEDVAEAIGYEGAAVGIEGAKLAIKALAKVVKLLDADYDSDDLEREMEEEAEQIEHQAERLEKVAEYLEESVEELEDLADELSDRIPELDRLEWF